MSEAGISTVRSLVRQFTNSYGGRSEIIKDIDSLMDTFNPDDFDTDLALYRNEVVSTLQKVADGKLEGKTVGDAYEYVNSCLTHLEANLVHRRQE